MGCVASKLEEEEEVVAICRERKRQLKLAVEKRYALAEAHCKYFHSLNAVAAAIKLFVARHSSPSSPFLITFPPPCPTPPTPPTHENVITNPMFLQQTPSETKHETIACDSCISSTASESSGEEESEEKGEEGGREEQVEQQCGYYYMHMPMHMPMPMSMPPSMPSPQRDFDFGWDFFYPFDSVRAEVMSGYHQRNSDDDLRAVREEEGIPELEEEVIEREELEHKVVVGSVEENNGLGSAAEKNVMSGVETVKKVDLAAADENISGEQRGLAVLDTPAEGRELLEALKDIEDHFIRAYDSGKDVTRMLEANRIPLHSSLEEIKGGSYLQCLYEIIQKYQIQVVVVFLE